MFQNREIAALLRELHLGSTVAETDDLLFNSQVETSAFSDLFWDRVDLVPGTKGSGKSALFRIFSEFLPDLLFRKNKIVIAHGVETAGDPVFHAYKEQFEKLSEEDFVDFWCIYLVSLARENFIKDPVYARAMKKSAREKLDQFEAICAQAHIPLIGGRRSLKDILGWTLNALKALKPSLKYKLPDNMGNIELDFFGNPVDPSSITDKAEQSALPIYTSELKNTLEEILQRIGYSLWLMIDRLDEIFPRRSELERKALRALLRTVRLFSGERIRVKVFLRDDMLEHVVKGDEGFTAFTHISARKADTLRWSQDDILTVLSYRLFANDGLADFFRVDRELLKTSLDYRKECFSKVFPPSVHRGPKQSATIKWIYNRCTDGRGVVTPRDAIELIRLAQKRQYNMLVTDDDGQSEWMIGREALKYGFEAMSRNKRENYLQAEFPHLWDNVSKLESGKSDYDEQSIKRILGSGWARAVEDLVSIGVLKKTVRQTGTLYSIPFLYRPALTISQGRG